MVKSGLIFLMESTPDSKVMFEVINYMSND